MLDLPDITKPTGRRDRALIALMLAGGLRISEALNLRISDINITAKGTLFVVLRETKKGYPDEQTISATAFY